MRPRWTTYGNTFLQFCKSREKPFYLIVDEAQIWYPMNVAVKAGKELHFLGEVKTLLKSGRDFSSYVLMVPQHQQPPQCRQSQCAFFAWLGMVRRALDRLRHPLLSWTPWTL